MTEAAREFVERHVDVRARRGGVSIEQGRRLWLGYIAPWRAGLIDALAEILPGVVLDFGDMTSEQKKKQEEVNEQWKKEFVEHMRYRAEGEKEPEPPQPAPVYSPSGW